VSDAPSTPPQPAADRNLLFGVLALQMDFVSRDALVAAMHAWVLDKARPLGQILVEQGALGTDEFAALEALVQKHLARHGHDPRQSLAAVSTCAGLPRELHGLADPDVQASLDGLAPSHDTDPDRTADTAHPPAGGAGARYRVVRPHAQGGLGQVFVAVDQELHREVALKEIREEHAHDPRSRARFLLEAEVTGRLESPGVVPVYGLGQYADGRPFYAMRLIDGETLKEAIHRFHAGPGADPGERRLALRQLLGRFVAVCNTIAYAHSRGVLNRDVKPSNVLLGKYGETLVVDWGLAKAVGRPEPAAGGEEALRPHADGGLATLAGTALGTPAYMSPEAAAGRPDRVGPASDIYGLGAMLYAILTGQAPVQGRDTGEVVRRAQQGQWLPPRQVNPGVPAALDAVCRRAMALRPEDRYATALALAADVEHWLADEPVTAYRERVAQRLGRWGRRHRAAVAGAAVLLVTAVLGLAAGLLAVNAERQRTEQARAAEAQRRRQTRQALDAMSSQVIEDWMARQKDLTEPQKKFLEQALASYEEFARDAGQDEAARAGVAGAYGRVGNIRWRLGQVREAEGAYRTGLDLSARLAADFPAVPGYRQEIARGHHSLGLLLSNTGRAEEAEREFREALAVRQRLAADYPAVPDYRRDLAAGHSGLGILLGKAGATEKAEGEFRAALSLQQPLAADHPDVAEDQRSLALTHRSLGTLLQISGRGPEAEGEYRRALALQEKLAADHPDVADYQRDLALTHYNFGYLLHDGNRVKDAEAEYRRALAVYGRLAADYPTVPDYRRELASSRNILGLLLSDAGQPKQAEAEYREALALQQRLAADNPTVPEDRRDVGASHNNLGNLLRNTRRAKEAEAEYRASLALFQGLAAEFPAAPDYRNEVAEVLGNLARVLQDRQDFAGARELLAEARPHLQAALQTNPHHPQYRTAFRNHTQTLAEVLASLGEHAEAAASADRLAHLDLDPANDLYGAACCLARCLAPAAKDVKLPLARRQALAREYADRSVAALRQAVAKGYRDVAHLRKDPDLDPVRDRDDFKKLLADVEAMKPAAR
jgi:serine/threonine-protein kinase